MTLTRIRLAALAVFAVWSAAEPAEAFPDRPVTLVVPFAPGGTIDVLARVMGPEMAAVLGQPVAIDTRPGAGGNVGAAHVAQTARADGHTLLLTGAGLASSVSLASLPFDPVRDLTPLAGVGAIPSLLVVSPQSPFTSLPQLLAAARAAPGTISFGSSGPGTGSHLSGVLLGAAAGVELLHVPYRGSGAVYPDLIAQRITMLLDIMASSIGQVRQGAVRALAITSAQRSEVLPEVPTVAEAGVPGYEFVTWTGFFVRAGTPEPAFRRLEQAALHALQTPAVRERLRLSAAQPIPADAAGFGRYFLDDVERWARMLRDGRLQRLE
ncbi:MAG TPA: tripartite tricarboxylate transporter substrate binding protein [Acetobacteraceae bacterium]|nr:tripartite tricarboxylate transporter substrate binding protein [Acetobacteraceae bacterium]